MHESAITTVLVRQIRQIMADNAPGKVVGIRIDLGEFTGLSAEHLQQHLRHELAGWAAGDAAYTIKMHHNPADPASYAVRLRSIEVELDETSGAAIGSAAGNG